MPRPLLFFVAASITRSPLRPPKGTQPRPDRQRARISLQNCEVEWLAAFWPTLSEVDVFGSGLLRAHG
jgi:hypothetical protein